MDRDDYHWLMSADSAGDPFDRHVFACVIASGLTERPLTETTGLSVAALTALMLAYFPHAIHLVEGLPEVAELAIEEEDLALLLTEGGTTGSVTETWLAAMVARRSLGSGHLWQDLGLHSRKDLSGLLNRHFQPLASRNTGDMKWKKFFYREMCAAEGMRLCKSPNCETCDDYAVCFGPEEGEPIAAFTYQPPAALYKVG